MPSVALLAAASSFLVTGAEGPDDERQVARPAGRQRRPVGESRAAQPPQDGAQLLAPRIVNGLPAPGAFPTVGEFFALYRGSCTGTLIGCHTVITAAHCVEDWGESDAGWVFFQHAGYFPVSSVTIHPDYYSRTLVHDIAILDLAPSVSAIPPTHINTTASPPSGTAGVIAGFGVAEGIGETGWGVLRQGAIETTSCGSGSVCWQFDAPIGPPGADSATCFGDSGGPLFTDAGAGLVLSGVTSAGSVGFPDPCGPSNENYDIDVYAERTWIMSVAGTDLDSTACGTVPQVTSAESAIHAWQSATGTSELWSFTVPPGASGLRVALNTENGVDFDLLVRHGSAPTVDPPQWDCASAYNANKYPEYCELSMPQSGTWYALALATGGTGTYQLTASVLGGSGTPAPSPTPTSTGTPGPTATATPSVTASPTATRTSTSTPTSPPGATPTPTQAATTTPTVTPSPTYSPHLLDIDDDAFVTALKDGLMILRYLFGFRGETLIAGAIGEGSNRLLASDIEAYLASILAQLDIDGDGEIDPLTDGLLILRYLFGFRGDALVNGAVDHDHCTRCEIGDIEAFLEALVGG